MKNLRISKHPLVTHYLTTLRKKTTHPQNFREALRQISWLLAYEATLDLPARETSIETPLQTTRSRVVDGRVAIVSILRAGLGMQEAFLRFFPDASLGHLGFYRDEHTLEPRRYFAKLPDDLKSSLVFLLDPMLATGGSLCASLDLMKEHGAAWLRCVTLVTAPEGARRVAEQHPEVMVITAALDEGLNEHGFILPGLGDAGDRQFGTL